MDFTLILVLVVLVTGVIMALDLAVLKRRRGGRSARFFRRAEPLIFSSIDCRVGVAIIPVRAL